MTPDELRTAIARGREQRSTEFKGAGARTDTAFLAKVIRAVLGMANKQDGGTVVIGVEDNGTQLNPVGLSAPQLATWGYDHLCSSISNYADPYVDVDVMVVRIDGREYVAIEVREFTELPVLCKGEYPKILRKGALYVRGRSKIETIDVPSHVEMREVIERAAEVVARKMIATSKRLYEAGRETNEPADADRFRLESRDLE